MLLTASDRMWCSLRMSVLSRLAGCGVSSLRWVPLDTTSGLSAWALGRSGARKTESDGGFWPTPNASDSSRGPESRKTKQARGAGGINQAHALIEAQWQTPTAQEFDSRRQVGDTDRQLLLVGQVKAAQWQTPTAADGGSTSRGGERIGEMLLGGQVRASEWATPNGRDYKDTGSTQGNRKSPNSDTQGNQADGPTSSG